MFVSFIARLIALTCKCTTLNKFFPELMGLNRCPGFPYWKWTRDATFAQEAVHLWELSCKLWETTLSPNLTIARQPLFKKIYKNHRTPPVPTIRYCIGLIREVKWKKSIRGNNYFKSELVCGFIRHLWSWLCSTALHRSVNNHYIFSFQPCPY